MHIPFDIKRVYYLYDVPGVDVIHDIENLPLAFAKSGFPKKVCFGSIAC
jgi:hypothetical protein